MSKESEIERETRTERGRERERKREREKEGPLWCGVDSGPRQLRRSVMRGS